MEAARLWDLASIQLDSAYPLIAPSLHSLTELINSHNDPRLSQNSKCMTLLVKKATAVKYSLARKGSAELTLGIKLSIGHSVNPSV
jgi:hypothetical protein